MQEVNIYILNDIKGPGRELDAVHLNMLEAELRKDNKKS